MEKKLNNTYEKVLIPYFYSFILIFSFFYICKKKIICPDEIGC